jgi:hypothetical protein
MENSAVRKQPTSSPKRLDHYVTTKGFSTNPMEMTHVVEDSLDFSPRYEITKSTDRVHPHLEKSNQAILE